MTPQTVPDWRTRIARALHCDRRDDELMLTLAAFLTCYELFLR